MIGYSSPSFFTSFQIPLNIASAVVCGNLVYLLILYWQRQRYYSYHNHSSTNNDENSDRIGLCSCCRHHIMWTIVSITLYMIGLSVLTIDVTMKFGSEIGLSLIGIMLTWIPGRIFCPLYITSSVDVFKYRRDLFNPMSYLMLSIRWLASSGEIIAVVWICYSLYMYSDDYHIKSTIHNAGRVTCIIFSILFTFGCNIWWCITGYFTYENKELDAKLIQDHFSFNDSNESHDQESHELTENRLAYSFLFTWFTRVLSIGSNRLLYLSDLPPLPTTLQSCYNAALLQVDSMKSYMFESSTSSFQSNSRADEGDYLIDNWIAETNESAPKIGYKTLIRALWNVFGVEFMFLGLLKLLICLSSFAGPLLLGAMVNYVQNSKENSDLGYGLYLVAALGTSFLVSAALNAAGNIRGTILQSKVKGALTKLVFTRAMKLPMYAWNDMALTEAKLINLVQVDVDRVADSLKSLHDLWTLPIQLIVAFVLLYEEVQIGFIVGVLLIAAMIPLNTYIASKINHATTEMMKFKDLRNRIISEALRGIRSLKMLGLESIVFGISNKYRSSELQFLAVRKYLDAACVFLWASTPIIVPYATFTLTALVGRHLTASEVFTTVALLNMLIFPMNAFPWVVNGAVESRVSTIRIASVLSSVSGQQLVLPPNSFFNRDADIAPQRSDSPPGSLSRRKSATQATNKPVLLTCTKCVWLWGKRYKWTDKTDELVQEIASTDNSKSIAAHVVDVSSTDDISIDAANSPQSVSTAGVRRKSGININSIATVISSNSGADGWVCNPIAGSIGISSSGEGLRPSEAFERTSPDENIEWFGYPSTSERQQPVGQVSSRLSVNTADLDSTQSQSSWVANPMTPSGTTGMQTDLDEDDASEGWRIGLDTVVTCKIRTDESSAIVVDTPSLSISPLIRRPSITPSSDRVSSATTRRPSSSGKLSFSSFLGNSSSKREDCTDSRAFWLGPISLQARAGEFWGVVGGIASGKTTFLLGCLDEIRLVHGQLNWFSSTKQNVFGPNIAPSKAAYCGQVPVLHSGTIRDNILMQLPFNAIRYEAVLRGCGLDIDMQAANWPQKDMTDVGESSGTALSGGQKLRVGIARALYSSAEVVLLDDPFSALDLQTSANLMQFLLQYVCKGEDRLVIVSTHSVSLLQSADNILVLKSGVLVEHGSFRALSDAPHFKSLLGGVVGASNKTGSSSPTSLGPKRRQSSRATGDDSPLMKSLRNDQSDLPSSDHLDAWDGRAASVEIDAPHHSGQIPSHSGHTLESTGETSVETQDTDQVSLPEAKPLLFDGSSHEQDERSTAQIYGAEDSEERQTMDIIKSGRINRSVYLTYVRAAGLFLCFLVLASTALMQATSSIYVFWLAFWVSHERKFTHSEFVLISSTIVGVNILAAICRSYLFAKGGLNAARELYSRFATSIFSTRLTFFEVTSFGKIVNRFGKDTNCVDDNLPFMLNIVLAQVFLVVGSILIISISDPIVIVVIVLVLVMYYRLQKFYRHSSRMLRRLDSAYRSPVYSLMFDCASNAACLRAMNALPRFDKRLDNAVDASLRASLSVAIASQWLSMRLQLLGALIATSLALSATLTAAFDIIPVSAGVLGLSLSYSFSIVANLNGLVGSLTETEQEMVSVERIQEYVELESESDHDEIRRLHQRTSDFSLSYSAENLRQSNEIALLSASKDTFKYHKLEDDVENMLGAPSLDSNSGHVLTGSIDFKDVRLQYSPDRPPALSGLTVSIPAGSKVAVVGRTGSGKSSLLRAMLRLNFYQGSIRIGDVDISTMPVHQLRRQLIVIPQDPVLLSATIRMNLDPGGEYDDDRIMQALQASGFVWTLSSSHWKEIVIGDVQESSVETDVLIDGYSKTRKSFGESDDIQWGHWLQRRNSGELGGSVVTDDQLRRVLNWELKNAGESLSHGQKQLLSLARALLPLNLEPHLGGQLSTRLSSKDNRSSFNNSYSPSPAQTHQDGRIVLIDEATASVDPSAEAALVSVLERYFSASASSSVASACTVLIICHRPDGIKRLCNKELRMNEGKVQSFTDLGTDGNTPQCNPR